MKRKLDKGNLLILLMWVGIVGAVALIPYWFSYHSIFKLFPDAEVEQAGIIIRWMVGFFETAISAVILVVAALILMCLWIALCNLLDWLFPKEEGGK